MMERARTIGVPLVVVVGEEGTDEKRVAALTQSGAVVVFAQSMEALREWLPRALLDTETAYLPHQIIRVSLLEIDLTEHETRWQGMTLHLTDHEQKLLGALAEDPGRVWTFEQLMRRVWGTSTYGDAAIVHSAVKRLRKRLASAETNLLIESVRGVGFRLIQYLPDDEH